MEYGSIERHLRIDAPPEVVFDVVSNPEHVRQWWPDEANYDATPGSPGEVVFTHAGERVTVAFQVVEAIPPRLFSFRWTHDPDEEPRRDNSFLVTFELEPDGAGTLLRMTETGFREQGWDSAKLEAEYDDHVRGWDHVLARIAPYVATLEVRR